MFFPGFGPRSTADQPRKVYILVRRATGRSSFRMYDHEFELARSAYNDYMDGASDGSGVTNESMPSNLVTNHQRGKYCIVFFDGVDGPTPAPTHMVANPARLVEDGHMVCSATQFELSFFTGE
eukprot:SAG31_NODE_8531_length_1435_cov_1.175150_1_plen_123_part_00